MWNKRRMDACVGHHWHVTGRGWSCCHCAGRVPRSRPAPVSDQAMACTDLPPPTSGLRKWVAKLAPATPVMVRRRRLLALPAGPSAAAAAPTTAALPADRELERV